MNIYIILGIIYLVYTIYNRYKSSKENRPTMQQEGKPEQPAQESLIERLQRLAREMEEKERRTQQEAQMQTTGRTAASQTEQEYPEEWVVTETGTKVHDLEGRRIKEEYLQSKEDSNNSREATIKEEYLSNKENQKSRDELAAEAYSDNYVEGLQRIVRKKSGLSTAPAKARSTSSTMQKRHKTHPIAKSIFGDTGARKAMIIKEIFDRPKY